MALTVADSRRKYLKYLIQASAAVLVSPWATPTYAEEAEDDEEEEPVVEKPKPKVLVLCKCIALQCCVAKELAK